jgi:hypothetical protein
MKKNLRSASWGALVLAIALAACDAAPPPEAAVSRPAEPEAIPPGETLVDVVREALADVIRDRDPYSRARRLGALLPTMGPELVPAVVETLGDKRLQLGAMELELLVRYWATYQPQDAALWAREESPPRYRAAVVYSALVKWAEADPQGAVNVAWPWMSEGPLLEAVVPNAVVRGWYEASDSADLRQFLSDLPMGIFRQRAINAYIAAVIETQGTEAVKRWAESLPDDDATYKLVVHRRVIDALSAIDISEAARWCEIHCDGPYGANMRSIIARTWVTEDGAAALAWLSKAPEGYERDLALRLAFAKWAREDRPAAMAWMKAQTTGEPEPWLRSLYPPYAKLLAAEAPAEAIRWAERIEDERERETVLIGVARVWRYLDEAAAEDWLLQSPLSEEALEKVRTPIDRGPQLDALLRGGGIRDPAT